LLIDDLFAEAPAKGAKQVAVFAEWLKSGKEINDIECFDQAIDLKFENTTIKAPVGYEEMLVSEFGDWKTIVKEGGAHEYPFYRGQINEFAKDRRPIYEYLPTGDEKKDLSLRTVHANGTDINLKMLDVAVKTLELIGRLTIENSDTIADLLVRGQELVVNIGEKIENTGGENKAVIALIEDFCECLYRNYVEITECGNMPEYRILLDKLYVIRTEYIKLKEQHREIIFMPVKYKDWKTMEKLYKVYIEDTRFSVKVMPIPYYHRCNDGGLGEQEWEYELFPPKLPLVDYREYDLINKHPYMYVVQNPWDEYGSGITVDFCFYSANLWKMTDNLVYIPFFEVEDFSESTEKAIVNLRDYVITPGVIYADKIWLQSENMKRWYIKCLQDKLNIEYKTLDEKISFFLE